MIKKGKMVCKGVINAIKTMKKYKIKTFNGSDMFGWDNWHNALRNVTSPTVELPEDLRYSSLESMKMSTSLPGQFLREEVDQSRNDFIAAKLGVVEEGAWADVLIWKGNPIKDISLILEEQNLQMIMKDGKVYKNLLVDPEHEAYRAAPQPAGHSFNL
ncbi:MAG: hypothetical protein V7731_18275 [Amphritea sp.]